MNEFEYHSRVFTAYAEKHGRDEAEGMMMEWLGDVDAVPFLSELAYRASLAEQEGSQQAAPSLSSD